MLFEPIEEPLEAGKNYFQNEYDFCAGVIMICAGVLVGKQDTCSSSCISLQESEKKTYCVCTVKTCPKSVIGCYIKA